jgi:hypothetical protein
MTNEIGEYIKKVMWYADQEYGVPMVSLEEFETMPHSNIFMSHILNFFLEKKPFQNCACHLVENVVKEMSKELGLESKEE